MRRVRAVIAYHCRKELGSSAAEMARHVGVSTSCAVRAIKRMAKDRYGADERKHYNNVPNFFQCQRQLRKLFVGGVQINE